MMPAKVSRPDHVPLPTFPAQPAGHETRGLTSEQAQALLKEHGPNEIEQQRGTPGWVMMARQFNSPIVWLLLGALVVAGILGEIGDAIAIGAIVLINAWVGFIQESRAERAIHALRSMTAPRARVLRDGRSAMVPAAEVVPGDVLLLEAGDIVAADARLMEAHSLTTNEAPLTGESVPAEKSILSTTPDTPLAERRDHVFMGTSVATGTGTARVEATGMHTELGRIAHLMATAEEEATPLQQRLARVSRVLLSLCLLVVGAVAVLGWLRGWSWLDVLLSSVSLAVAAVPEGLPAIVTIALALGVQRMASRHVLVRRLPAVETLGCASVICTDKTGTLTTGVMAVREISGPDHERLLFAACSCCDAELGPDGRGGIGDPTEIALLAAGAARGIVRESIERERPRMSVHPFDSDRKRMSVQRANGTLYVKGAPESVLPLCTSGLEGTAAANEQLAIRGLRVLAVAIGTGSDERDLELLGLVGIADPPRTEAIDAVARAREAGIRTVMITGDHPVTAAAIAREMGILRQGEAPDDVIHARATPEDKIRIVRSWKVRSAVVAMTGDGVNDAPALREAHIGIAMGRAGTEVTREASDMVLTDDNFASIVGAVEEGRGIFDNIRKTLVYLLSGNAAELLIMFAAAAAGMPLPLLPLHLLWINLVTDGLPALALIMDPPDEDVLRKPPRRSDEPIIGRAEWMTIASTGLLQAGISLGVFMWAVGNRDLPEARNLAFSTLVFGELFRAFAARSSRRLFWEVGAFSNMTLLGVIGISALVQLGIHHIPLAQQVLSLRPLSGPDCLLSMALGVIPVSILELAKLARRWWEAKTAVAGTA